MKHIQSNKLKVNTINKAVKKGHMVIIKGGDVEPVERVYKSGPCWKPEKKKEVKPEPTMCHQDVCKAPHILREQDK